LMASASCWPAPLTTAATPLNSTARAHAITAPRVVRTLSSLSIAPRSRGLRRTSRIPETPSQQPLVPSDCPNA
jgi:hypothetical protein